MSNNLGIDFYESKIEELKFYKTCLMQANSFYKTLPDELEGFNKKEIVDSFFEMEKGKSTNQLDKFFVNIHKQIESILNYSITKLITLESLSSHLEEKTVTNYYGSPSKLFTNVFFAKDGVYEEYNYIKQKGLSLSRLSFTAKINIFYIYFIESDQSKKDSTGQYPIRSKKLSFTYTNSINDLRNYFSHGNFQAAKKKMEDIRRVLNDNEENIYWFYPKYYKILYTIYSVFITNLKELKFKF